MGRCCDIRTELVQLRAELEASFNGRVVCPLLEAAEDAHQEHCQAAIGGDHGSAKLALEALFRAVNLLHSELSDRDHSGTDHCIKICNFIHPEPPVWPETA